ncbi:hypothetical protein L228DRAFT_243503 [Xylona heveae TC161]|uniref:Uncharacterized protein n=1 Tax=Xylona heveae (strain CBS 132557 / TC161) TaxID=1328760 RepID=A0A165K3R1_XYLHT|nr:hypothetical protein L228DRAFT_243503 [Xylona heveae TC161]KZF26950.1 hypothetical protein L228DRAFT_243503 [Xylona heveae TC161]
MSFPMVGDNLEQSMQHQMRPRPVPRCNWKCCQNCRPTFRERTYLSFDAVFRGQVQRLPKTRPYRPPISDVNIVRKLGLRQSSSYLRQVSSMELTSSDDESTNGVSVGHASHISHLPDTNTSEDEDKEEVEVRKSWRASMKKAWKGMLPNPRIRSDSSSVSIDVGLGDKLASYDADAAEFDIGLWKEMSQAILDEATKIKLPGGSDEQDSEDEHEFGAGEVEVDGGVAVMEESVENRDADIIMQV